MEGKIALEEHFSTERKVDSTRAELAGRAVWMRSTNAFRCKHIEFDSGTVARS